MSFFISFILSLSPVFSFFACLQMYRNSQLALLLMSVIRFFLSAVLWRFINSYDSQDHKDTNERMIKAASLRDGQEERNGRNGGIQKRRGTLTLKNGDRLISNQHIGILSVCLCPDMCVSLGRGRKESRKKKSIVKYW